MMLSLVGLITALADKYDNVASITNFVITPLSFLSARFIRSTVCPASGTPSPSLIRSST